MGCTDTAPSTAKTRHAHSAARDVVLVVSSTPGEGAFLRQILKAPGCTVRTAHTCRDALGMLASQPVSVILAEASMADGGWEDILKTISVTECAPKLIVTSPVADERLWMKVLNMGAYDLMAEPFDTREVPRILALALESHRRCS